MSIAAGTEAFGGVYIYLDPIMMTNGVTNINNIKLFEADMRIYVKSTFKQVD